MKLGIQPIKIPRGMFTDPEKIKRMMRNTVEAAARDIKIDFKVTAQTWDNKPTFTIDRSGSNGRIFYRVIGTNDRIYKFVSGGTRVRYATMTPDFEAKTRVRVIGSRTGRGGVAYINTKKPRPGIKARRFEYEIAKKWQKLLPQIVERALRTEIGR